MSLYINSDIDLLKTKWEAIMTEVEKEKLNMLEPSYDEMLDVHNTILDYISSKKRKIYGGYALNLLIKQKNEKDRIYKSDKISDIDFYSPRPILDVMEICNILQKKGFKHVIGREAMHQETYSIFVNTLLYCDISYVPKNIYDRMQFKEIDGLYVIHPHFMMIDYLRMMSDPLISYWRFDGDLKAFKRMVLLQKYYPLPVNNNPIDTGESDLILDLALDTVFDFLTNKNTVIVFGFYAYNYFLHESGLLKLKSNSLDYLNVPYYEIISTNYRDDVLTLLDKLKSLYQLKDKISHEEFYPYFQFTDYSTEIYCEGELILRVYNNNKKCIPYQDFECKDFKKLNKTDRSKKIRLATFPTVLLFGLISVMRGRTNNNDDEKDLYYTFCSHIISMRNNYLDTNKKTIFDDSVFKEFVVKCIGDSMLPDKQKLLLIESRKKKNRKYMFRYEPASDGIKEPDTSYIFANSSGNKITNPKNLKLSEYMKDQDIEGDFDEEIVTTVEDGVKTISDTV